MASRKSENVKVVVFVPESHAAKIRAAIGQAGAGKIGNYTYCTFSSKGTGRFLPGENAAPTIGQVGKLQTVAEERIEFVCPRRLLKSVVSLIKKILPYEEVAIDSYSLERLQVVDFESKELHHEVVEPMLRLIHKPGWKTVETAYENALKEITVDPSDAITDATTALQEGLKILGCKGNDFTALVKDAKVKLLKGYDEKYLSAIEKLVEWASAARVNKGDVHKSSSPSPDDAWFVVHLVGALLLRLSKATE